MVSQLLAYTNQRLDRLEGVLAVLQAGRQHGAAMAAEFAPGPYARLACMQAQLARLKDMAPAAHKAVTQESMHTGEIELF
jgi:hypothetical protein